MAGEKNLNSIEPKSTDLARSLFYEDVTPLSVIHAKLHLNFKPDRERTSYYQPAHRPVLTRADMEQGGRGGELGELAALWTGTPLATLLPGMQTLAEAIAGERDGSTSDSDAPSTLVYQMY